MGLAVFRKAAGTVLLSIGIAGLLVPVLPGWLLIFVGLALLGVKSPFLDRLKERARLKATRKTTDSR